MKQLNNLLVSFFAHPFLWILVGVIGQLLIGIVFRPPIRSLSPIFTLLSLSWYYGIWGIHKRMKFLVSRRGDTT